MRRTRYSNPFHTGRRVARGARKTGHKTVVDLREATKRRRMALDARRERRAARRAAKKGR